MINCQKLLQNKVIVLLVWVTCCTYSPNYAQSKQEKLREIAKDVQIPGMQIAYSKGDSIKVYTHGIKRFETNEQVDKQTRFQAASLTKVMAAYAFFRLMDKGIIELDKPLLKYYPYDRLKNTKGAEKITARMVLTHRSGLLNWEGDVPSTAWRAAPLTLQFEPGTDYMYSGEGFYFLQETLEHITKKSFQTIVEEEVLQPLNLKHSNIVWNDTLEANAAFGHYSFEKPRRLGKYAKSNAAYTLYTTAEEYTRFVQKVFFEGFGLKESTHEFMLTKADEAKKGDEIDTTDKHVPCALISRMQINEKGTAYWHTGSNPGFRCFFITYPDTKETLVAFMNTDEGFPAMKKLMQLFLDKDQKFWAYDWRFGELD